MKIKNIVFFGFFAAILAVNCAPVYADEEGSEPGDDWEADGFAIASASFVERQVAVKANKVYVRSEQVDNIATVDRDGQYRVSDFKTTDFVKNADVADKIAGALTDTDNTDVQEAVSGVVNNAIGASMTSQDAGSLGAELAKKEDAANKVSNIEANKDSDSKFPTTKAVAEYTAAAIASAVDSGIDVNSDMIANGAITSDKIADGAVTEDKLADGVKTKLDGIDGKADKIEVTSGQAGNIATVDEKGQYQVSTVKLDTLVTTDDVESVVEKYTVSVPKPNCDAESGLCLLSTDTNGNLTWVNVTNPADVSVQ